MKHRRESGLTLLEVVLALTLTVGMMIGVLAFYRHVLTARANVTRDIGAASLDRILMDRLTGELRGTMVYPFLGFGMDGQVDQIKFISISLPGPAAWAVRQSTEDPIPPEVDMQMVGYRLRITVNEEGEFTIDGLERTCQKILGARETEEGEEIEVSLLSPHMRFIRFRYWKENDWVDTWTEGGLPLAVEIVTGAQPLPEDMEPQDYPTEFDSRRRVVYLPAAEATVEGPIIRGLGGGGR